MQKKNLITKYIALLLVLVTLISNLVVVGFGANPSVSQKPVTMSKPLMMAKSSAVKQSFKVSFIDNEHQTFTEPQSVVSGTNVEIPVTPIFDGYAFMSWHTDDTNTVSPTDDNKFDLENAVITTDTNLYAHWDDHPLLVLFFMNDYGNQVPQQVVAHNGFAIEPTRPTADHMSFSYWYTDTDLKTPYDFSTPVTENINLYAMWEPSEYKVDYVINNIIINTSYVAKGNSEIKYDYKPVNCQFDGNWYDPSGNIWNFNKEITENLILRGKLTATVNFNNNGIGKKFDPVTVEVGSFIDKPNEPTASGYTFNGWYTDNTFKTKWNFRLNKVKENTTLYAKWSAIPVAPAPAPSGRGGGGGGGAPKEKYQIETNVEKIFGDRSDLAPFTKEIAIREGQGSFVEHYPDGSLVNFSAVIYDGNYNIDTDPIIIHVIDKFTTIYDYNFVNENTPQDIIDNLKLAYEEILSPGFAEKIIPELKKEYRKTTPRVNIDLKPEDIVISDLLEIDMDDFYNGILNSTPNAYVHFGVNASSSEEDTFYAVMHRDMETGSWLVANIYALEQGDNVTLLKLDFDTMCPTIILRLTDSGKNKVFHYFDNPPVVVPVPGTEIEIDVPELVVETTKTVSLMLLYIIIIVLIVTMIRYYQYRREGKLDKFRPRLVAANMKVDILDWYKYELPQYRKNVVEWIATTKARFQRTVSSKATYASLNTVDSTKDLGDSLKLVPLKVKKFFVTTAHRILESIKISKQRAEYRKANDTLLFKDKILLAVLGFCAWVVGLVHKLLERIKVKREKKKESNKLTLWQWIKLGFYTIVIWGIDLVHKFLELCRKSSINKSKKKSQAESKPAEDKITFKNKVKLFFYEVAAWILEVVEKLLGLFK